MKSSVGKSQYGVFCSVIFFVLLKEIKLTENSMFHTKPTVVAMWLERYNFCFNHFPLTILLDHGEFPPAIIAYVFRIDSSNITLNTIIEKSCNCLLFFYLHTCGLPFLQS